MYDNIGGKIKGLATAIFIIEAIVGIIYGIALMATDEDLILIGLLVLVGGPIVAWVSSWLIYGFGELIDKTCDIERNTRGEGIKGKDNKDEKCMQDMSVAKTCDTEHNACGEENKREQNNENCQQNASVPKKKKELMCPKCASIVCYGDPRCKTCGQQFDW